VSVERYVENFAAFSKDDAVAVPKWARKLRREGIERFAALGFPTTRDEDWRFTSVAPIAESAYQALHTATGGTVSRPDLAPYLFGRHGGPTLVFVNGRYDAALSSTSGLPDGLTLVPLAEAWTSHEDVLEKHLGQIAGGDVQAFTALNTAFMYDGALVVVGKEMEIDEPVHLVFVSDSTVARTATHPRILIVAERHSKATVIESWIALGESSYFTNAVTEVHVADGATLNHYKVQRESPRAFHVGTIDARQGRDSHFVSFSFAAGAALSRTNIYTVLGGEGCGATLNGLYMLADEQHGDHQTRIEHAQPNCFSREVYKGILDDASHGVFNGKVYVHAIAQKTDGKQTNNTLLLSEKAHIDTKPQLEIFADDVKCTHGATVGRLDQTALFYMKSRGVGAETARKLLTYAFAADVLETIEHDAVREGLEALTLERFAGAEAVA
jgi:Fe-S cluster assembly protein SufD